MVRTSLNMGELHGALYMIINLFTKFQYTSMKISVKNSPVLHGGIVAYLWFQNGDVEDRVFLDVIDHLDI